MINDTHFLEEPNAPNNIENLIKQFHTSDRVSRQAAIAKLRQLDRQYAIEYLKTLLASNDGNIRCEAAMFLLLLDIVVGIQNSLPLLKDPLAFVRGEVCGLFHDFGDESVVEPLIDVILHDPDADVRHIACYTLGRVGDVRALPALEWVYQHDEGMNYDDDPVKNMAELAIQNIRNGLNTDTPPGIEKWG